MNERTMLEVIAPTVEEALAQGLTQLGLPAEAVTVEVLDAGAKGLFGLGGRQVRVRLTVNPPAKTMPPGEAASAGAAPVSAPERKRTRAKKAVPALGPEAVAAPIQKAESQPEEHDPLLDVTEAVVSKLLFHLGFQAQVSAHYSETERDGRRPIHVDIRGQDLAVLIGRRGETLSAFQYIVALMVSKEAQQWVQLVVDVEGHRDRRERQLRQLAHRMAEQVIKSGRKLMLEPMPAAERRIIHIELRDHPAVKTESVGEEPHRKVTIIPKDS